MRLIAIALLGLGSASLLRAQSGNDAGPPVEDLAARIAAAAALPALVEEIRGAGVSGQDVSAVLGVLGERRVPATDARVILEEEWKAAREHGPVPGLGRFVRGRLDEGLRGTALAAAIRAEHARRGTGGDAAPGASRGRGERGASGAAGRGPAGQAPRGKPREDR